MIKTRTTPFLLLLSIGFCLDLTSGGKLSNNQSAMDVTHYNLKLKVDPYRQTISGLVIITFKLFNITEELEIDLMDGYTVSGTSVDGMNLAFNHKDNKIMIDNPYIFALIKVVEPNLKEFTNTELTCGHSKVKILKPVWI